ncbi:MAG: methyltransferase domain-containing protein [Clostridia bacterium]|nr:methyltransferase domain-containing protein [Clostridia bacterium]
MINPLLFCCSVCGSKLEITEHALVCTNEEKQHSFDMARQGYVHLVKPNKMHSKNPGDTKLMVDSRREFLTAGYYDIFADKLCEIVKNQGMESPVILDCGCGEGYYTGKIKECLPNADISGFDISKLAVKAAAGKYKNINFAVSSVFDIPVPNESVDILTDVFSPLAEKEFLRVLKKNGVFIYAVPGERHLWGLKEVLYENPYENEYKETAYEGFELTDRITVKGEIRLYSNAQIMNLFSMTPYYWKTDIKGSERLRALNELTTEIHFDFLVYKKI